MQIFGDLAVPSVIHTNNLNTFFKKNGSLFDSKIKIVNLEGLVDDQLTVKSKQVVIFNHSSIIPVLKTNNFRVACLANNHTLDFPDNLTSTRNELKINHIESIGATITTSSKNDVVKDSNWTNWMEDGKEVYLYNACWDFLLYTQMNPATNGAKVNIIDELELLSEIETLKKQKPAAIIITYFHWSFDLETLPFPSYRKFSHDLIDRGVNLVVGCHSHCIQPVETYNDGVIVYGLGNFYFPNGTYLNGKLNFPKWSQYTLIVDFDVKNNTIKLHKVIGENKQDSFKLVYINSFDANEKTEILNLTGLSDKDYLLYYKKYRRKKKLIPIFKDYKKSFINNIKYLFLIRRAMLARKLAEIGLRQWQN